MPSESRRSAGDGPTERLGSELRELQARTGKSLKDLESDVHVSDSSLSRYLAGRAVPPWPVVERLSALVGRDPEPLRALWEEATTSRRTPASTDAPVEAPADKSVGWRHRHRRLLLVTAFVATAVVFGTGGVLVGRQFGTRPPTLNRAEDDPCRSWPWPANAGLSMQPPVRPQASDHSPTIELMVGKASDGRNAAWARITNAAFGDRVWLDASVDGGRDWTQCGPFPVSTATATTRAHDTGPGLIFRACGDVPTPVPNARGEICTNW